MQSTAGNQAVTGLLQRRHEVQWTPDGVKPTPRRGTLQRLTFSQYSGWGSVLSSYTPEENELNRLEVEAVKAYNSVHDFQNRQTYKDATMELYTKLDQIRTQMIPPAAYGKTKTDLLEIVSGSLALKERVNRDQTKLHADFKEMHDRETLLLAALRQPVVDDRAEVERKLDDIGKERRQLIGRTIAGGHKLWLPSSVSAEEVVKTRALWSSISQNKGNIKVATEDANFRTAALSDISKLLQSGHGRTLLGNLNKQQPGGDRSIDIGSTAGSTDNAPKGKQKDKYVGEGSRVSINYAEPSTHSMGVSGGQLYDPTYIKLGHELGHASHYLAGTAGSAGSAREVRGDQIEEELWTSEEEYNNITREENPLRKDLGLEERRYHKGFDEVIRTRIILPELERLNLRKRALNFKEARKHLDLLDKAEEWLHPTNKWSAYQTADLNTAIAHARAAMTSLEEAVK